MSITLRLCGLRGSNFCAATIHGTRAVIEFASVRGETDNETDCPIPGAEQVAERPRDAVAADGKLSHLVRHMPCAATAGWEEDHVAGPKPAGLALLVGDEDLSRDDVQRLVHGVMPLEASRGAGPSHYRRGAVGALREPQRICARHSLDDPVRMNRIWIELDGGGSREDDRF